MRPYWNEIQRVVIKVGTSTLTHASGGVNLRLLGRLAVVLGDLRHAGLEVVLVSSGALAVGMSALKLPTRPQDTPTRQAAAAVGQCELMFLYDKFFRELGISVGQLLLTRDDFSHETRRTNLLNTFTRLLELGVLPIVNENDSVSTEELEGLHLGDNDNLSAMTAQLLSADLLVFFTDTEGLYTAHPQKSPDATQIHVVPEVTEEILTLGGAAGTARGTGGMSTKLHAAKRVTESGIDALILHGEKPELLWEVLRDGRSAGTWFQAQKHKL